jgi:hypothetical protein
MLADDKWSEAGLWDALRKSWWEDLGGISVKELYDFGCIATRLSRTGTAGGGDHGCDETSRAGACNHVKVLP